MNKVNVPQLRFPEFEGEWKERNIEDLCAMQAGKFISASEIKENFSQNLFPCYGGNGLRGYTKSFNYDGNYSLIGRQGALCGNITFVHAKFHATEHAIVVKVNQNIDNKLMYYILNILNLNQYATGQAQPGLSVQNIKKVGVTITESLPEQQKIASFLSSVDEKIQQLSRKKELVEQYKKGVMQQLFSSTSSEQRSGKLRFKDDNGNDYPDWEEKKLGEVLKSISTKKHQIKSTEFKVRGKFKIIDQGQKIVAGYSDLEERVFKDAPVIVFGDHTTILKFIDFDFIIGADGTKILKNLNNDNLKYLFYNLSFNNVNQEGYKRHFSILSEIILQIPSIPEQQKIANFLSNIDVKIENTNQEIKQMQKFKKGLLQQMFV